ncbi:MAG: hypothetical protein N3B21_14030 [Clostridia bacterium]|nr:hypothetical protein [Clostridia bacterium]
MSTSFQVYPCSDVIPKISEVASLAKDSFEKFLREIGIFKTIQITFGLISREGEGKVNGNEPIFQGEGWSYIYFSIFELNYICHLNYRDIDYRINWDKTHEQYNLFIRSYDYPYCWNLEGRNILKGFIAGTIAKLTDGFVDSGDGAWDSKLLPTFGNEFLNIYPRPEKCLSQNEKEWYKFNAVEQLRNKFNV